MEKLFKNLGEALKTARQNKHFSQEELAERIEVSPTHIKHIESGHRKPSIEIYFKLIQELDFSTDSFINAVGKSDAHRKHLEAMLNKCSESDINVLTATAEALIKEH